MTCSQVRGSVGCRVGVVLLTCAMAIAAFPSSGFAQIGTPSIKGGGGTYPDQNGGSPNNGGTSTAVCPTRLVGRVEDVDGNGNLVCRYKIFIASNCVMDQYKLDLPCSVNKTDCMNGTCQNPNTSNLIPVAPPDPNATPQQRRNPNSCCSAR
jgi:hypothetical protein